MQAVRSCTAAAEAAGSCWDAGLARSDISQVPKPSVIPNLSELEDFCHSPVKCGVMQVFRLLLKEQIKFLFLAVVERGEKRWLRIPKTGEDDVTN